MTLSEAIQSFLTDLELTDRQASLVAQRQNAVRQWAESNSTIDIENSLLIGSYARDTQIRPPPALIASTLDVDALLILQLTPWNIHTYWDNNDGGTQLLQDVHSALSGYPALSITIDRPSITIKWKDMKMELTPAFKRPGGGYLIPAKYNFQSQWTLTDPITDAEKLTSLNKRCSNQLKPLIKMLKCWNRGRGKLLGSFAIETQAFHSAQFWYNGYETVIPYFFGKLIENDGKFITPPSGVGDSVFISLGRKKQAVEASKQLTQNAFYAAQQGNHRLAISYFGKVFGKPFPGAN